jgi:hypothetical protein
MMALLVIASRFCGLPDSGNGGYVCGFVAARLGGQAEITLPARLSTPLHDRSKRLTCRNAQPTVLGVKGSPVQIRPSRLVAELFRVCL